MTSIQTRKSAWAPHFPPREEKKLLSLLRQYKHIFTWKPIDMVGISREIIENNLNIRPGNTVVKQKRRGQVGDMNKAINVKVDKLVQIGILRETTFPFSIANLVMVRKHEDN